MLFNSFIFFIFLLVVIPIYYLIPRRPTPYRNSFLLVCSYIFYSYWDWRFSSLLIISTILDFYVGKYLYLITDERKRKYLITLSVVGNLAMLGFFKYFNFFIDSFSAMTASFGLSLDYLHLSIILPAGISFYTFQTLTYSIDIYRKKLQPTDSLLDFALYISFFPQLVAGPIERASNLLPQITNPKNATREQIEQGLALIVIGLFKKVMIGDTSGRIVDQIFGNMEIYQSPELLMALILFTVQIYADFSGYSNIARGSAKLMGFELMKNFEQPYFASNISDFWRRWHISLSTWLKDYVYFPLGGNRKGNARTYVNLMIIMLVSGLWHGASWTFVFWGALHGVYMTVYRFMSMGKKIPERYEYAGIGSLVRFIGNVLFTNLLVIFSWIFFRAKNFDQAFYFINKIMSWEGSEFVGRIATICTSFVLIMVILDFLEYYTKSHTFILKLKPATVPAGILAAMFLVSLIYMFQADPMPFIYFQF
ncbi:MAG: MBOAT family protein [Chlorobiales bacterium]|jgi:alginate O-acetyltransferase complex protein AlgI|nr:MBOAT family protein [Chlorobiales bacterium]